MKGLLGYKVGMSQVFDETGSVTPVTIVQAGPCYVTQIKTVENDGYNSIQVGFAETSEKRLSRGELGHLGRLNSDGKTELPSMKHLKEFRVENVDGYEVGQELTVDLFEVGGKLDVTGKTKGRGFAGVVKRHGFAGGPKTHGQSDRWRAPGSIGSTSTMARVMKGMKMGGRMGNITKTIQNLQVIRVDTERNLIAVKGAVPGPKGGLVVLREATKS